jgi:hypothetical protein
MHQNGELAKLLTEAEVLQFEEGEEGQEKA